MSQNKLKKLGYEYWSLIDSMTLIDAAFVLVDIEPRAFDSVFRKKISLYFREEKSLVFDKHFYALLKTIPSETILKMCDIYLLLYNVDFPKKYRDSRYYNHGASFSREAYHPYLIVYEAIAKKQKLPKKFLALVNERFCLETGVCITDIDSFFLCKNVSLSQTEEAHVTQKNQKGEQNTDTKEKNRKRSIGIMAHLLSELSDEYKYGNKTSAKAIKDKIVDWAEDKGLEARGLTVFERELSEAIQYVDEKVSKVEEI